MSSNIWIDNVCYDFFRYGHKRPQKVSKQRQKESYRISMRKLRTFYWKVTEFLKEDESVLYGILILSKKYLYKFRVKR